MTQLEDDDNKPGDHKEFLRARLLLRRAFFASVLAFALVAAASGLMEEVYARKALWIPLAILAWLAMIGIGMFLRNAECPRCSNRFAAHASGSRYNSLTLTCLNCGLSHRDSVRRTGRKASELTNSP